MKRTRRRLHIPQHEFGFTPQAFNLFQDTTLDGERIAHERDEADHARRAAEAAQSCLFTAMPPDDD
jgi:ABC-type transport system involved in Fe-S cluster assembly fused permease/ATPase subunit